MLAERRLRYHAPLDLEALLAYLRARAVTGLEAVDAGTYVRSLRLAHGCGTVALTDGGDHVFARFELDDERDLPAAELRARLLLDLDCDPDVVLAVLGDDPLVGPLVRARPGRRVPGAADGTELGVRAVLGQQISLAGAATAAGRLIAAHGEPLARPAADGRVTHAFPTASMLAAVDPATLAMPRSRARALVGLCASLAADEPPLQPGAADPDDVRRRLVALPGIGPWTAEYVAMRALRDPDAFPAADLGIRRALERHGLDGRPAAATALAERWRPYRAYAVIHLWAELAGA